jgi:hypothetical protein
VPSAPAVAGKHAAADGSFILPRDSSFHVGNTGSNPVGDANRSSGLVGIRVGVPKISQKPAVERARTSTDMTFAACVSAGACLSVGLRFEVRLLLMRLLPILRSNVPMEVGGADWCRPIVRRCA